jgi:hypothetical protein
LPSHLTPRCLAFQPFAQRRKGADRQVEVRDGGGGAREPLVVLQQSLRRQRWGAEGV